MKCIYCHQEREIHYFLPCRQNIERHDLCVLCMQEHYQNLVEFLKGAAESPQPDQHIEKVTGKILQVANAVTCQEMHLASMEELKTQCSNQYMRPNQRQFNKNLLSVTLKCAGEAECDFQATAMELIDNSFILQILQHHSCDEEQRDTKQKMAEVTAFCNFVEKLKQSLPPEKIEEAARWSTSYSEISSFYKDHQQQLHELEDKDIDKIWENPCRWKRARGKANEKPGESDLQELLQFFQKRQVDKEVEDYITANFHTEIGSQYFQQRGYFLLLFSISASDLLEIIEKRIQIMLYAYKLLQENMFFLCYKRLNCTVLRNHIFMIVLLIYALKAQKGEGKFPLLGFTQPKDSEDKDFYEILEQLSISL